MSGFGTTVWVAHVWRDWETDTDSQQPLDTTKAARQYAHWRFADQLAAQSSDDDVARGVVMQKLWNAVDGRVRLLFELYELRTLARRLGWTGKQKPQQLEVLVRLGLLRPLALNKLKNIRNAVEHADEEPPSQDETINLVDLVWYFLRSTDTYVSRMVTDFEVFLPDAVGADQVTVGTFHVGFTYPVSTWTPTIAGKLRLADLCAEERLDLLAIDLTEPARVDEDGVFFSGTIRSKGPAFESLVRSYFRHDLVDPD